MARMVNARNGVIVNVSDERAATLGRDYSPVEAVEAEAVEAEADAAKAASKPAKAASKPADK